MFKKTRIQYYHLLIFSILLGGFLRFFHIGSQPLWLDEAYSNWFSARTMRELWTIVPHFETNPPLYYSILKVWTILFGSSEACLRSLSAFMSMGCIPLVFMIGRLAGGAAAGNWSGALAAFLFSVSPLHIEYAQEARQYAMLTFAVSLVLYLVLWIMTHPEQASEPLLGKPVDPKGNRRPVVLTWLLLAPAVSFTLWLHNTAVLYIITLFLIALTWSLTARRTVLGNLAVVGLVAFLLWAPYVAVLIRQATTISLPIEKPTALSAVNTVFRLLLGSSLSWTAPAKDLLKIAAFVLLVALALGGLLHIRRQHSRSVSILLLGAVVGPILMELLITFTLRPIFLTRTLVYVSVPFFAVVAAGIMSLRDPRKRALIMIILSLVLLRSTQTYHAAHQKEPWDEVAQIVAQRTGEDAVLLVPNNIELPLSYYAKKINGDNLPTTPLPFPMAAFLHPAFAQRFGSDTFQIAQIRPSDIPAIHGSIAGKSPVWLITRAEQLFDRDRIVFNVLMRQRNLISSWHFGEISVFKFK